MVNRPKGVVARAESLRLRSESLRAHALETLISAPVPKTRSKKTNRTESDLASVVVAWLDDLEADVYQEVFTGPTNPRADIVARVHSEIWSFEVKRSLSFDVIAQARHWRGRANRSWVVVQSSGERRIELIRDIFSYLGIGLITINFHDRRQDISDVEFEDGTYASIGRPDISARLFRTLVWGHLGTWLRPEQKVAAKAGSARGGHWTPFKSTVWKVVSIVSEHPDGISISDVAKKIGANHHYSRDAYLKPGLVAAMKKDLIPGCETRKVSGKLFLFPKAKP